MNRFTPKQRAEIVTLYSENSRSVVLTQRAYRRKYRGQQAPSDNTIRRLVSNFVKHGTLEDRPHAVHQRPRRSNELVEAVRESVAENPHMSYRRRAEHFGISGTTLRRILKDDLQLQQSSTDSLKSTTTESKKTVGGSPGTIENKVFSFGGSGAVDAGSNNNVLGNRQMFNQSPGFNLETAAPATSEPAEDSSLLATQPTGLPKRKAKRRLRSKT